MADQDGLRQHFDKYQLDAMVCSFADLGGVPIVLAAVAKYG